MKEWTDIDCDECGGSGHYVVYGQCRAGGAESFDIFHCPTCEGTGVKREESK